MSPAPYELAHRVRTRLSLWIDMISSRDWQMNQWLSVVAFGAATGMRSMRGAAAASAALSGEYRRRRNRQSPETLRRMLASPAAASILGVLALGEALLDKTPVVPDRIDSGPVAARVVIGAALGVLAAPPRQRAAGLLIGGAVAAASAYGAWAVRREIGRRSSVPDAVIGIVGDLGAARLARSAAARL